MSYLSKNFRARIPAQEAIAHPDLSSTHHQQLAAHIASKQPVGDAMAWVGPCFHISLPLPTVTAPAQTNQWHPLSISHRRVHLQESCGNLDFQLRKNDFDMGRIVFVLVSKSLGRVLSPAGKEVLIKAVLDALSVFTMACFKLPISVGKEISRMYAQFWWSKGEN
ncbi:RNA-directed DNA polymerase (reversetranscriptase)-related family protein [Striga asiatica]|uniref:RNA-directed DNA polymerase (Reversetranscriptase)-related family protein n=1 Tax=Striga asiatica TaxID=4170 RepID=A0A5A7QED6_STRAF|nr:RNA-directed DNA polymerase (reversetranscriptase)-related family protein [Striga asiatica]